MWGKVWGDVKKCWERFGKGRCGERCGGVWKCWVRCGKVCWVVGKVREDMWGSVKERCWKMC